MCVFATFQLFLCGLWVYLSIRHRSLPEMLHLERKSFIHRSSSLQRSYLFLLCVFLTFNNAKFLWIFPAWSFSLSVINLSISIICQARRAHLFQFFFIMCWMWMVDIVIFKFYKSYILFSLRPKLFFCVCPSKSIGSPPANIFFLVINRKILSLITSRKLTSLMSSKLCVFYLSRFL